MLLTSLDRSIRCFLRTSAAGRLARNFSQSFLSCCVEKGTTFIIFYTGVMFHLLRRKALITKEVWILLEALSNTRASCFIRTSRHFETIKAPRLRRRASSVSRCFEPLMKPSHSIFIYYVNNYGRSFISEFRFKVAPYSFLTARELVSKSRDGASLKKSTRKWRAKKRNEMSTNMASKFVKKKFLEQLRESLQVSKHLSNEHKTLPFRT